MIEHIIRFIIPATFSLLPVKMRGQDAAALLTAIGLQESRFEHRRQIGGPARGFWQFEAAGVDAVLNHPATAKPADQLLRALQYPDSADVEDVHYALEHNDILAAGLARLLLWSSPLRLPGPNEKAEAWALYVSTWRPGKPKPCSWENLYIEAWERNKLPLGKPDTLNA